MHSDVLVIGGGPAGLAAAIAARAKGLQVTLVDSRKPPIDKPCGEGLLPEAVSSLKTLGVDLDSAPCFRFAGIQFTDGHSSVSSRFLGPKAYGIRRTVLHRLLLERAEAAGVSFLWGAHVTSHDALHAEIGGQRLFFRWLVAADGLNSNVRRRAKLASRMRNRGRFAFRRHYAVRPWTDLVEVHWGDRCQIIVTPTDRDEICVALFTRDHRLRIDRALEQFPALAERLHNAQATSVESGARTALARARFVIRGNVALVGDAACSIDGIAGQGLSLAFQSANHLANALACEDLCAYAIAHREMIDTPMRITRLMLLMARHPWIRRKTMRMFAAKPALFGKMIQVHAGAKQADAFGLQDLFGLGWRVLRA
jgi:2-polyprenyl-6-methoxyphenol hydroxylase-like FAD-dependent oxidoreductase